MFNRLFSVIIAIGGLALGAVLVLVLINMGPSLLETAKHLRTDPTQPADSIEQATDPVPAGFPASQPDTMNAPLPGIDASAPDQAMPQASASADMSTAGSVPGTVDKAVDTSLVASNAANAVASPVSYEGQPTLDEVIAGSGDLASMAEEVVAEHQAITTEEQTLSRELFSEIMGKYLQVLEAD